jgi:hypothetical protein
MKIENLKRAAELDVLLQKLLEKKRWLGLEGGRGLKYFSKEEKERLKEGFLEVVELEIRVVQNEIKEL